MTSEILPWIDLETTGLSAEHDVILEMGIVLTDKYGTELASFETLVADFEDAHWINRVKEVANATEKPDTFVRDMHEKSALFSDLDLANRHRLPSMTTREAENAAINFLNENNVGPRQAEMFGSSIGSLDRPFVLRQMPDLNAWFHYRNMDNSSVKILCQKWRPDLVEIVDAEYAERKASHGKEHRVLEDCRDSIAEYQFYLKHFLRVEPKQKDIFSAIVTELQSQYDDDFGVGLGFFHYEEGDDDANIDGRVDLRKVAEAVARETSL